MRRSTHRTPNDFGKIDRGHRCGLRYNYARLTVLSKCMQAHDWQCAASSVRAISIDRNLFPVSRI